jgi:hypothetical protein
VQQTIPVSKVNLKPVTLYIVIFSIPCVNVIVLSQQEIKILWIRQYQVEKLVSDPFVII